MCPNLVYEISVSTMHSRHHNFHAQRFMRLLHSMDTTILALGGLALLGVLGIVYSRWNSGNGTNNDGTKPPVATPVPQAATPTPTGPVSTLPTLSVYYGSQTGTAEGFSKQIVNDAKRHGFRGRAIDLDTFTPEGFVEAAGPDAATGGPSIAIFVLATYGEGDPTDNALKFTKWIKVRGRRHRTEPCLCSPLGYAPRLRATFGCMCVTVFVFHVCICANPLLPCK